MKITLDFLLGALDLRIWNQPLATNDRLLIEQEEVNEFLD